MQKITTIFLVLTMFAFISCSNDESNKTESDSTTTKIKILQTENVSFYEKLPIPQEIEVTINSDFTYKVPFINSTVTGMPEDIKFSVESTGTNITT